MSRHKNNGPDTGKVGSDRQAVKKVGGKGDFGISVKQDIVRDHESEIESRPAGSAPGYSGSKGIRTTGVGSAGGETGHDSGGDLDTDFIGLDGRGGLAAKPVCKHDVIDGPDEAGGPSDNFATGNRAKGRSGTRPGTHGAAPKTKGDFVDHSGEDTSTNRSAAAGSVTPERGFDSGSEGEVNFDEATGNVEQGGET